MDLVRPSDAALRAAAGLSDRQRELLNEWLSGAVVTHDRSWGLKASVVYEVATEGGAFVVKAGNDADRSVRREVRAHQEWTSPWTVKGLAPRLEHADVGAKLPLLGERRPRGPLLPVTTEAHRAAAAQMARHFRREGGYDYSPYDPDDDASQPLLILSNYYGATFPVVAGAVGMTHDNDRWALAWVWIHPYERGFRGSGSAGLFSVVWDALEAQYGEFYVEGPYSAAMRAFMTRRGIDPSRYASGTFD